MTVDHPRKEPLQLLMRELTSAITSFAPGTAMYVDARPKALPIVRHFSCLIAAAVWQRTAPPPARFP